MTTSFRYDSPENYSLTYSKAPNARHTLKLEIFGVCLFVFIFFPLVLWLLSYSDYPVHDGRRIRSSGYTRLIFLIPVYLRLPLVVLVIVGTTSAMIAYLARLRDHRVDYLFGPDGVAHIGLFASKSLTWNDIEALNLVDHRRRHFFKSIHAGNSAEFVPKRGHGAKVRVRSKLTALLSLVQTNTITVSLNAFDIKPEEFEGAMLLLRPNLEVRREERISGRF